MDIAITIFRIGVGAGAVLVGLGIILIAFSLRPLVRDARALANDARRLANLAEKELSSIVDGARELTHDTEVLTEDLTQRLARLRSQTEELEGRVQNPAALPPVQSRDAREDERIA